MWPVKTCQSRGAQNGDRADRVEGNFKVASEVLKTGDPDRHAEQLRGAPDAGLSAGSGSPRLVLASRELGRLEGDQAK